MISLLQTKWFACSFGIGGNAGGTSLLILAILGITLVNTSPEVRSADLVRRYPVIIHLVVPDICRLLDSELQAVDALVFDEIHGALDLSRVKELIGCKRIVLVRFILLCSLSHNLVVLLLGDGGILFFEMHVELGYLLIVLRSRSAESWIT